MWIFRDFHQCFKYTAISIKILNSRNLPSFYASLVFLKTGTFSEFIRLILKKTIKTYFAKILSIILVKTDILIRKHLFLTKIINSPLWANGRLSAPSGILKTAFQTVQLSLQKKYCVLYIVAHGKVMGMKLVENPRNPTTLFNLKSSRCS